jgi:peptidoglycan/xylan/chitin deacetylase (PgdA/CDA1 family)
MSPILEVAKRSLKVAVTGTIGPWTNHRVTGRVVVLCYHSVHPSAAFASASPDMFASHLDWIADHCQVVPLRQVPICAASRAAGDRPIVAITFDDGYIDNFEYAFPQLERRGLAATFFVTAGLLEKDSAVLGRFMQLRRSDRSAVRPLEWDQVRAMHDAGMEIGVHTYSHPNLARLSSEAARDELRSSKDIVEARIGHSVRSLAYPFGKPRRHFTDETTSIARETGYEYACAVLFRGVRASDSRFEIPRFFVSRDSLSQLEAKVTGAWDVVGLWQEKSPLWLAKQVSPLDFRV